MLYFEWVSSYAAVTTRVGRHERGYQTQPGKEFKLIGRPRKQPDSELAEELRYEQALKPRWRDEAHCRALPFEVSDSLFFDVDTNDPLKDVRVAFCGACPVQRICRLYGDVNQPDYGAYGGLTASERRLQLRYKDKEPPYGAARAE